MFDPISAAQLISLHHAQPVIELARDHLHLPRVIVEMLLLAGHFEMAATGEVAVDGFLTDDLLDAIDRWQAMRRTCGG